MIDGKLISSGYYTGGNLIADVVVDNINAKLKKMEKDNALIDFKKLEVQANKDHQKYLADNHDEILAMKENIKLQERNPN